MKRYITGLIVGWLLFSCNQDEEVVFPLTDGTYAGIFYRSSPNARWATANVRLTLQDQRFSGSSNTRHYPAIGEGTFSLFGSDSIRFSNERVWTADFDWTFILDGTFQLRRDNGKLIIQKHYSDAVFDTYELSREE